MSDALPFNDQTRFEDLVGCRENTPSTLLEKLLRARVAEPRLNVATRQLKTRQTQCCAAKVRRRFSFGFLDALHQISPVHHFHGLIAMQEHMRQLVEPGLVRHGSQWADGD